MKNISFTLILILSIFFIQSCNNEMENEQFEKGEYNDGTYCAEVTYFNPNSGDNYSYNLEVEIQNNQVVNIHWDDDSEKIKDYFAPEFIDARGNCNLVSVKGYEYSLILNDCDEINNSNSSEEIYTNNDSEATYTDDASNENNEQNLCELCGRKKDVLKSYCWICENKNNAIKNENPFTESEANEMEEADEIFNRSKSNQKVSAEEFGRAAQIQFSTQIRANQR